MQARLRLCRFLGLVGRERRAGPGRSFRSPWRRAGRCEDQAGPGGWSDGGRGAGPCGRRCAGKIWSLTPQTGFGIRLRAHETTPINPMVCARSVLSGAGGGSRAYLAVPNGLLAQAGGARGVQWGRARCPTCVRAFGRARSRLSPTARPRKWARRGGSQPRWEDAAALPPCLPPGPSWLGREAKHRERQLPTWLLPRRGVPLHHGPGQGHPLL